MGESYALLAAVRQKELPTRLVIAVVLTAAAQLIATSIWPVLWLGAVVLSQAVDWAVYRPAARGEAPRVRLWLASTAATSAVYSALSIYLWREDGQTGRLLALLLVAGSLLHVTVHMHHVRKFILAAAVPHAIIFFALPLSAALMGDTGMWPIVLGATLYTAHLVVAFRQSAATTGQIQAERIRAEQASKAKSDFLATISHEIRTPMNAIVSAATLLGRSRLSRAQREHVEMLTDANDVLLSLLNDVLDLSRIEAGKMQIEPADLDLPRLLSGLQRLWRPRAADKGLELRLDLSGDAPRYIVADALRLKQILFNLLSNAVKFTQTGSVTVRAQVFSGAVGEMLVFEVIDTGEGIAPEVVQRLFGAFEQGDAGITRAYGGSGLGLAISRRLAELMDGELVVDSTVGAGSTFRLTIPLVAGTASAAGDDEHADEGAAGLEGLSILVAEDHPVNQRVLELLLAPLGCRLTFCDDGQKAVDQAALQPFDAILMDMQMPVLDGLGATEQIKSGGGPNAATPIIALTANALEHHRAAWAEVGVHAFISKPIDPRQLIACLQQATRPSELRRSA